MIFLWDSWWDSFGVFFIVLKCMYFICFPFHPYLFQAWVSCFLSMAAIATSSGPRYAPEDPSLPKPWRGLVDGKTGYLYFWNPETNVTQYERPTVSGPPHKSSSLPISSSVHVQQSSQGPRSGESLNQNKDSYERGSNDGSKLDSTSRSQQVYIYVSLDCVCLFVSRLFMWQFWNLLLINIYLLGDTSHCSAVPFFCYSLESRLLLLLMRIFYNLHVKLLSLTPPLSPCNLFSWSSKMCFHFQ